MPKCLIVYFSQTSATARASEHIAAGLRASGFEVGVCNIKDEKPPDVHNYDVLGIGFPVYAFKAASQCVCLHHGLAPS
jgi:flavodoxin